jgi:hypothetical protein
MTRLYDQLIGVPWFRRDRYDEAKARMADPESLPATYDDWLTKALKREAFTHSNRETPNRVLVDDDEFFNYCLAMGAPPNRVWRSRYALERTRYNGANVPLYEHPTFNYGAKWSVGGRRRR